MKDLAVEFSEHCADQRWFVEEGWVPLHVAADNLQLLAERGGYVEALGQDEVQRLASQAFAPLEMPTDYASQLLRKWELADPRDRWKWTGELPPDHGPQQAWPARKSYATPQSTVEAFFVVMESGDQDRIAAWLRNHPDDVPALLDTLEAA